MTPYRIMMRAGTAAEWVAENPVLALGELGLESDTGRWKVGDGVVDNQGNVSGTEWNELAYIPVRIEAGTPASAGADGVAGAICRDSDYLYVCVATDTWKRAAIETWEEPE